MIVEALICSLELGTKKLQGASGATGHVGIAWLFLLSAWWKIEGGVYLLLSAIKYSVIF